MAKIIQFQLDNFGRFFLLYEDGSMVECEQENTADGVRLNVISKIKIDGN
jgi:hypothetical protein